MIKDVNTPLLVIDRSGRPKISKDTDDLNSSMSQFDLTDIYRIL